MTCSGARRRSIDFVRRFDGIILSGQQRNVREAWLRSQGSLHRGPLRPYCTERSPRAVIAFHKLDVRHPAQIAQLLFIRRSVSSLVDVEEKGGLPSIERPNQTEQLAEIFVRQYPVCVHRLPLAVDDLADACILAKATQDVSIHPVS